MNAPKRHHKGAKFRTFFNEQNSRRPTRLGVFERNSDVVNDCWLESGMPLLRVDLGTEGELPTIRTRVGELKHELENAVKLLFHFTLAGDEDGPDILPVDSRTAILRFEEKVLN